MCNSTSKLIFLLDGLFDTHNLYFILLYFNPLKPQQHILTAWFEQNWSEDELKLDKPIDTNNAECEAIINKMFEGPKKGNDQVIIS